MMWSNYAVSAAPRRPSAPAVNDPETILPTEPMPLEDLPQVDLPVEEEEGDTVIELPIDEAPPVRH